MQNVPFLSYAVSQRGCQGDVAEAMTFCGANRQGKAVATLNAHSAVVASENTAFERALQKADLLLPDGISVVLGARFLGQTIPERVSGYDFFSAFSQQANAKGGLSYFFLGSSESVLAAITERMAREYPAIRIAGTLSPPFKPVFSEEENEAMCRTVNESGADVLWVGMTAPKQELWIEAQRDKLKVGFSCAIGAVFDFYAGTKKRAPAWVQKAGFEWLYRLCLEPKRMWGRYVINNPRFVAMLLKSKFKI